MPDQRRKVEPKEMTDQEIRDVFKALKLPTGPASQPPAAQQPQAPVIHFRITGDSPPLPN